MAKGRHTGGGSRKGIPNKVTADVRATISLIARRNIKALEGWLREVAKDDPGRAADLYLRMLEYHVPKLQRSEHTGENGTPLMPPVVHVHFTTARQR